MEWKDLQPDIYKATIVGALALVWKILSKKVKTFYAYAKKVLQAIDDIEDLKVRAFATDQRSQAILHLSRNPYFLMSADGDLEYVNPAWCEMLGYSDPEDAYGMGYMRAIPDEDVRKVREQHREFTDRPSISEGIMRFQHIRTKEPIMCKYRTELLTNEQGDVTHSLGILEIISSS